MMRGTKLFLAILAGALLAGAGHAATPADTFSPSSIDAIVERAISDRSIAGAAVTILVDDQVLFSGAYGATDPGGADPVTANTAFRLGSISKFFTALAMMRLVEEGRLSLDAAVADLLTERPAARLLPRAVTVRRLLNHTSGLGDLSEDELSVLIGRDSTVADADVEPVLSRALIGEPGSSWAYSNSGYRILSWIVERASGRPFHAYIKEIVAPGLGLSTLRSCDEAPRPSGFISREGVLEPDPSYAVRGLLGDGGLCASASDLALVPSVLLRGQFISQGQLEAMVAPTILANGVLADYGMGVRRGTIGTEPFWGHSGSGLAGGWAALAHYPERRVSIAVLANGSGGGDDAVTLHAKVAAAFLGVPPLAAEPVPSEVSAAVVGRFADSATTVCFAQGDAGITRRTSASRQPPRPLLYQGDGVFARADYPLDRMVFQIEGERAVAHRVYYDGFFAELLLPTGQAGC